MKKHTAGLTAIKHKKAAASAKAPKGKSAKGKASKFVPKEKMIVAKGKAKVGKAEVAGKKGFKKGMIKNAPSMLRGA